MRALTLARLSQQRCSQALSAPCLAMWQAGNGGPSSASTSTSARSLIQQSSSELCCLRRQAEGRCQAGGTHPCRDRCGVSGEHARMSGEFACTAKTVCFLHMTCTKSVRKKAWLAVDASAAPDLRAGVTRARQARPSSARIRARASGENIGYHSYDPGTAAHAHMHACKCACITPARPSCRSRVACVPRLRQRQSFEHIRTLCFDKNW
jgi:hypothetical protein